MQFKILYPLLSICLFLSCDDKQDDFVTAIEQPYQVNEETFKNETTPVIRGYLDGKIISWNFGFNTFQSTASNSAYSGITKFWMMYGLNAENNINNHFRIYTPEFDIAVPNDFENTFSLGEKRLGEIGPDFNFQIVIDSKTYTSTSGKQGSFKILRTQQFLDSGTNGSYLRVWFRVKTEIYNNFNGTSKFDGVILAQFYGFSQ